MNMDRADEICDIVCEKLCEYGFRKKIDYKEKAVRCSLYPLWKELVLEINEVQEND